MNEQEKNVESCQDEYFECVSECSTNDPECEETCVTDLKECDVPAMPSNNWKEYEAPFDTQAYQNYKELMTKEEDEGELISELLQITALLGGKMTRESTLNSTGRQSQRIVIEYNVTQKD